MGLQQTYSECGLEVFTELFVTILGVNGVAIFTEKTVGNFRCNTFNLPVNRFVTSLDLFRVLSKRS
jgi:hypothetical protein